MIAVSCEHHLAGKKMIEIEDLHGETLMMVKKGDSGVNDLIRSDLEKNIRRLKLRTHRVFTICPCSITAPKRAMFCSQ